MARTCVIVTSIISLALLVTIILIACSLSVLNYNEVGLNYSSWFKTIENRTEPYVHGIHFIGLGHSFQKYEISLKTLEFSKESSADLPMISCRTKDGLQLEVEASLQYAVDENNIFKIYTNFGNNEFKILQRIVLDVISDTSTMFTANDFFTKRSEI